MPKCQKLLEKGKKKGKTCDIYSNKEYEGKYYCSSHIKPLIEKKLKEEEDKNKFVVKFNENENDNIDHTEILNQLNSVTLENGYSMEDCMEATFQKLLIENQNKNNDNQNDSINEKLRDINTRLLELENKYKNVYETNFEVFK